MKNKAARYILCLSMAAMLGLGSPAVLMAAQTEEGKTEETKPEEANGAEGQEAQPEQEEEKEPEEERIPEDVTVALQTGDVVLKNETTCFFSGAEYKRAESKVVETVEGTAETAESEQVAQTWDLVLTEEEGTVHTFKDVRTDKWLEPVITEQFGILYIQYLDETNEKQEALETLENEEEKTLEKPVTVYTTTDVNVRETPDTASASLKVTARGEEWSVVAALPGWVKVEGNGVTGYVHHEYVTEDKENLDGQQNQDKDAATVQTTAQQNRDTYQEPQSAYQEPQYSYQRPQGGSQEPQGGGQEPADNDQPAVQDTPAPDAPAEPTAPSEPSSPEDPGDSGEITEINRETVESGEGDGHGYHEITYSDGSVVYEEF